MIPPGARPRLARKVKKRFDRPTQQHMLVYPERGMLLNDSSHAIIELCTGELAIEEIVERLHQADPSASRDMVTNDVHTFLTALLARGVIRID